MTIIILLSVGELLLTVSAGALLRLILPQPREPYEKRLIITFAVLLVVLSTSIAARGILNMRRTQAELTKLADQDLQPAFIEPSEFQKDRTLTTRSARQNDQTRRELVNARFQFAHHLYREKDYPGAHQQLEAVSGLVDSAVCYNNLAALEIYMGDATAALNHLTKALQIDSTLMPAHYNLGILYIRTKRSLEPALAQFQIVAGGSK